MSLNTIQKTAILLTKKFEHTGKSFQVEVFWVLKSIFTLKMEAA
jgi:hypothetical protein